MKPVRFHPEAQVELVAEAKYYEERSAGLGKRFLRDMEVAIGLASAFPDIGAPYRYGTRRVFPKSFSFGVVYRSVEHAIIVLAIAPFPRRPGYWHGRMSAD